MRRGFTRAGGRLSPGRLLPRLNVLCEDLLLILGPGSRPLAVRLNIFGLAVDVHLQFLGDLGLVRTEVVDLGVLQLGQVAVDFLHGRDFRRTLKRRLRRLADCAQRMGGLPGKVLRVVVPRAASGDATGFLKCVEPLCDGLDLVGDLAGEGVDLVRNMDS